MTEQNTLSISELEQQAHAGDAQAQLDLAGCYLKGEGVEQDKKLAFMWMKTSAGQGNYCAQCNLILLYPNEVIEEDVELALEYLTHVEDSINSQEFQEASDEDCLKNERKKVSAIFWAISRRFYLYAKKQNLSKCLELLIKSFEHCHKDVNDEFYLTLTADICGLMEEASLPSNQQKAIIDRLVRLAGEQNPDDYINCMVNAFFGNKSGVNDEITFKRGDKYAGFLFAAKLVYSLPSQIEQWEKGDFVHNPITNQLASKQLKKLPPTAQYAKENFEDVLAVYIEAKEFDSAIDFLEAVFKNKSEASTTDISGMDHDPKKHVQAILKDFKDKDKHKQLWLTYLRQAKELDEKNKQLDKKNTELNNLIAMFAHNFLGTLQCIRSNAEHENNPKIHLKTVKMMGGALTAFSIISADDDKLVEQLKQDNRGETTLLQCLANNLALAISQLLSKTNKDKIINLYLNYLQKTAQITPETTGEDLRFNDDEWRKWDDLQRQWDDEFNALFSEQVELNALKEWISTNFFAIEIIGFDKYPIHFKEYGITDSIFLVVLMETLVNALKYIDVKANKPLILTLCKANNAYQLSCENPSRQESYRGTHKGMDFLQTIAKKLNGKFINESTESNFKTTFIIPAELLD